MSRVVLFALAMAASAFAQRIEPAQTPAFYQAATYPTKPGVYHYKGWRYVYEIEAGGTPCECRIGRLFLGDQEIPGSLQRLVKTTGRDGEFVQAFAYFGDTGYNRGWLNTLTSDQPVFEQGTMTLTSAAKKLLFRCVR